MSSLLDQARRTAGQALSLLDAITEEGDLCETIAGALLSGHALFLVADPSHVALAGEIASAVRRRFPSDLWPPLLTLRADSRLLALIGSEYGAAVPLSQQVEELVRSGDVALLLAGSRPSADLAGAAALAAAEGATVASLGLASSPVAPRPALSLPQAPIEQLVECQLILGHALVEALAQRLPPEAPPGIEPALAPSACSNCNASLAVPRHLAGRRGVCPFCFNNTTLAPGLAPAQNEKRTHMRFALRDCSLSVSLAQPDKPPVPVHGQILLENLSVGGLLFSLAGSLLEIQPSDALFLSLSVPAFERLLVLDGTVVRVTREAALHLIAVVFRDLAPATAERLRILERNLVLRNLTARPAPP